MWSFQARKEFWVDVYTLSLSCVTALEERCGIFPVRLVGRSVGGDHRFGGEQALPQRHQHLLEWCTNWYQLPRSTNYFCQCNGTEHF